MLVQRIKEEKALEENEAAQRKERIVRIFLRCIIRGLMA